MKVGGANKLTCTQIDITNDVTKPKTLIELASTFCIATAIHALSSAESKPTGAFPLGWTWRGATAVIASAQVQVTGPLAIIVLGFAPLVTIPCWPTCTQGF